MTTPRHAMKDFDLSIDEIEKEQQYLEGISTMLLIAFMLMLVILVLI